MVPLPPRSGYLKKVPVVGLLSALRTLQDLPQLPILVVLVPVNVYWVAVGPELIACSHDAAAA